MFFLFIFCLKDVMTHNYEGLYLIEQTLPQ